MEERAIGSEITELTEVIAELGDRLRLLEELRTVLEGASEELLRRMDTERRSLVTPLLREFERVQFELGQQEQRREFLIRLEGLQDRVSEIQAQLIQVDDRLHRLLADVAANPPNRGEIVSRTGRFAEEMNSFISRLPLPEGIGGPVSIDPDDFRFYVGRVPWQNALGDERRVVFFTAYHYASLLLAAIGEVAYPGLAVLDNPFQQDVDVDLVESGLVMLSELCAEQPQMQVVVTTRRALPQISSPRIHFERVFNPQSESID